jgi:aminoglycoside phosphotransferase (APT) family kinase protein
LPTASSYLVELHELPYEKSVSASASRAATSTKSPGWSKRYLDARPTVSRIERWPTGSRESARRYGASLIHNDFKYDNVVLDPADLTRVIGVLDWEMSTIGDPMMDLATALSYWIQEDDPAPLQTYTFGPTNRPGSPSRAALLEKYAERRPGSVPSDMRFYNAFALFKNAVVAQRITLDGKRGATQTRASDDDLRSSYAGRHCPRRDRYRQV